MSVGAEGDYSHYDHLLVTFDDGIATVTMNRPEILNSVNSKMYEELTTVWGELNVDSRARVIVFTGAGRAFCAGGDLNAAKQREFNPFRREMFRSGRRLVNGMLDVEVPIVGAINGDAVGLGATLAFLCDVTFADRSARFGEPHVKVGAVSGDGGVMMWSLLAGPARAKQYLMTGDLMPAEKAERVGLINEVVDDGKAYEEAMAFARKVSELPPIAIRWTKHTVNSMVRLQQHAMLDSGMALKALTLLTDDHYEGVSAFVERRKPHFEGH